MTCHLTCGYSSIPQMRLLYDEESGDLLITFAIGSSGSDADDVDRIVFTGFLNGEAVQVEYTGPWTVNSPTSITIEDLWDALGGESGGDFSGLVIQGVSLYDDDLPEGQQQIAGWSGSMQVWDPDPPLFPITVAMDHAYGPNASGNLGADRLGLTVNQQVFSTYDEIVIDTDQATDIDVTDQRGVRGANLQIPLDDIVYDGLVDDGDDLEEVRIYRGGDLIAQWTGSVPFERKPKIPTATSVTSPGPLRFVVTGENLDMVESVGNADPDVDLSPGFMVNDRTFAINPLSGDASFNATLHGGRGVTVNDWTDTEIDFTIGAGPAVQMRGVRLVNLAGFDGVLYPFYQIGENPSRVQVTAAGSGPVIAASETYVAGSGLTYPGGDRLVVTGAPAYDQVVIYTDAQYGLDVTSSVTGGSPGGTVWVDWLVADGTLAGGERIESIVLLDNGDVVASWAGSLQMRRMPRIYSGDVYDSTGPGLLTIEGDNLDLVNTVLSNPATWPSDAGSVNLAFNPSGPQAALNAPGAGGGPLLNDRGVTVLEWSASRIRLQYGVGPAIQVDGVRLQNPALWIPYLDIGEDESLSSVTIASNVPLPPAPIINEVIVTP